LIDFLGLCGDDEINNAVEWLKEHHPELFVFVDPVFIDSYVPGNNGGMILPFGITLIDTDKIHQEHHGDDIQAWIGGYVAHETMHQQWGFIGTIILDIVTNGASHQDIRHQSEIIRQEYESWNYEKKQ
jgi:hypothetical protein